MVRYVEFNHNAVPCPVFFFLQGGMMADETMHHLENAYKAWKEHRDEWTTKMQELRDQHREEEKAMRAQMKEELEPYEDGMEKAIREVCPWQRGDDFLLVISDKREHWRVTDVRMLVPGNYYGSSVTSSLPTWTVVARRVRKDGAIYKSGERKFDARTMKLYAQFLEGNEGSDAS